MKMFDEKPDKNMFSFRLGDFMKEKILDMYGILGGKSENSNKKKEDYIYNLLPNNIDDDLDEW